MLLAWFFASFCVFGLYLIHHFFPELLRVHVTLCFPTAQLICGEGSLGSHAFLVAKTTALQASAIADEPSAYGVVNKVGR